MSRFGRVGVTLALFAGGLAAPVGPGGPGVVGADEINLDKVLWFSEDGADTITIGPNGAADVWLGQIDYMCDTFYPVADVYVVAGTPAIGSTLTDVSGAPNVVFGSWGGGFSETIAYAQPSGKLGLGTYSVVYDECQDEGSSGHRRPLQERHHRRLPAGGPPADRPRDQRAQGQRSRHG